ncbi:MAG: aa3-type cytochrome c oxidase subunit IV [Sandaracinobacteroides sp.]
MADTPDRSDAQRKWDQAAPENRQVYSGFLGLSKWAIILIALVLVGMAIFLV